MHFKLSSSLLALLASPLVSAQTFTLCDPTKRDCPPDPAFGKSVTVDFTKGPSDVFELADGTTLQYDANKGAIFSIRKEGDAPTIHTPKYIFYGRLEVECKAAPGVGVVSSIVLQSDTLDEIDWEWLGGDNFHVQTNYFSKGDTSTYDRSRIHSIPNAVDEFHTYTMDWNQERIEWLVDGNVVRTLMYADAKGGAIYPQTPMQIKLGTWVAGRANAPQGTIDWAGGRTDYKNAPFEAYYKRVTITDYMGGKDKATSYVYGDRSGTSKSIIVKSDGRRDDNDNNDDKTKATETTTKATTTSTSKRSDKTDETTTMGRDETTMTNSKIRIKTTLSTSTAAPTHGKGTSTHGKGSADNEVDTPRNTKTPQSGAGKVQLSLAGLAVSGCALFFHLF